MYTSKDIAAIVLKKAEEQGQTLTPMQLIKLTYMVHGYSLGMDSKVLIKEDARAWRYGPVYPELYDAVKKFGSSEIPPNTLALPAGLEPNVEELVDAVVEHYKDCDAIDLSALTHQPNTPWDITVKSSGINSPISNDLIESHYKSLIAPKES